MTSRCRTIRSSAVPVARGGATLTEVLISIMVMSVGILSVMAMFPISILRSIQATQLTNASILRENVRQQVATFPAIVHGVQSWRPGTDYSAGDLVVPQTKPGHRFNSTNRIYRVTGAGNSGYLEPAWPSSGSTTVNGVTYDTLPWTEDSTVAYVVDPLGWNAMEQALGTGAGGRFGNFDNSGSVTGGVLHRLNAGIDDFGTAAVSVGLPDSWVVLIDDVPVSLDQTSVNFASTVDLGVFSSSATAPVRVVVTSFDGTQSVVRSNVTVNTSNVTWTGDLPDSLDSVNEVSRVRVEVFERRYTWFITARRDANGQTRPQCVVLFNRSLNPNDEYLYEVTSGGAAGSTQITVRWQATEPEPLIREGNYLFDGQNALWYRIQSIDSIDTTSDPRTATITLDRPAELPFGTDPTKRGGVMFLPGIIDIFEL